MSYASDLHRLELRRVEYTQIGLLRLKKRSAVVGLMMIFRFPVLPNTLKVETDILTTGANLAKYIYVNTPICQPTPWSLVLAAKRMYKCV